MSQFEPDIVRDSENEYMLKQSIQSLDQANKIIFCLYMELASERQVAEILGVSRTPIHKLLQNIKNEIISNIENNK